MAKMTREEQAQTRAMLVRYGFSAAKAAEIALDASRGDEYALSVCVIVAGNVQAEEAGRCG